NGPEASRHEHPPDGLTHTVVGRRLSYLPYLQGGSFFELVAIHRRVSLADGVLQVLGSHRDLRNADTEPETRREVRHLALLPEGLLQPGGLVAGDRERTGEQQDELVAAPAND